ncbi:MAG: tRNA uridine-5-carboxymethylaminomethyl(34) synthesis GTPase MnmE [Deltaproteobacteria bacterium]|nr:tRNA uridine-5-carboxymethylaminomethyl(34) synthesis GTPase MnmE [Deltaproteobacteria bacterium]
MSNLQENDTIAAIATPYGMAGIGIIRISGPLSLTIAERLFRSSKNRSIESHRLYHGHFLDPSSDEVIDEVLLSYMNAPHTYTREDIVEINSHSGPVLLSKILQVVLAQGVRLAKPGEFTFRAFLNNRIDLIQAEAVMDLINAKSERGIILSNRQLSGESGKEIRGLRDKALDLLAMAEVAIDYPEEESITHSNEAILYELTNGIISPVEKIIASHSSRKIWIEGIDTVITGRVNTGKSSLLNRLIKEEKAIVSPIPGTTRDLIETTLYIKGIPLKITDTAGLREGKDAIELIGIDLARKRLKEADIALAVIDQSRPLDENDRELLSGMDSSKCIIILNKVDLPKAVNEEEVRELSGKSDIVKISALTGEGIDLLEEAIVEKISETDTGIENHLVPNIRQKSALSKALEHLHNAVSNLRQGQPMEIIAVDLKSGIENLEEVTGETSGDDLYDRIFSNFCLGK